MNYTHFQKPGRYINSELNSIHKKAPVTVALAFPDVYEIGMSHLGLKILYRIINNLPFASAERVFAPWPDLEEALKTRGMLLTSLESRRPLKAFDIVGFSLQYELSYTTVLNMLHLGGVALRSEERLNTKNSPLVIAGGPCTVNPLPMAAFIDAFLVGDGEDAVPEILHVYNHWKAAGQDNKYSLLQALTEIEGVYVPALRKEKSVNRRYIASLEDAPFPDSPVLPFMNIVHDRINIEISRGCTMGCRFCQAGMTYRPVRERSPERILELAENSLRNTGYDALSFTSLSSGDYSCLTYLMKEFNRKFYHKRIAISLPSLRVGSVNQEMLQEIKAVRKSGFTIAPEAGTDRLRAVINKDVTEETYISALETLFGAGWRNLKLYFMSGLPTETSQDIEAIPEMVMKAAKLSRKLTGRPANISVGVSSFIPKPHTPFQWFGQNDMELLKEKNRYLRKNFLKCGIQFKGHREEMSLLEAVFARGDERLSALIEAAWSLGCRLDAWTDLFDFDKWKQAMDMTGIDAAGYAVREFPTEAPLPWDNINAGVTKEYLLKEYHAALEGSFTSDCRKHCHACGLKCRPPDSENKDRAVPAGQTSLPRNKPEAEAPSTPSIKIRLEFSKTGNARYLSHLELTSALIRAMRRASFPFKYSRGFSSAPIISFGPALRVGIAGLREYLDAELLPPFDAYSGVELLNRTLPEGISANKIAFISRKEKSLDSFINRYVYDISNNSGFFVADFFEKTEIPMQRNNRLFNMRDMVEDFKQLDRTTFQVTLRDIGEVKVKLAEVLKEIFSVPVDDLEVTRVDMFGWDGAKWKEPMEEKMEEKKIWAAKF
ncbi:MAG: B12-binding domain-containing radical SAM protein [Nitrospira bacterium HGW-Nitrospira-1]|nr:MAG: B12-binding domain-containing radical SAM protein [Nitrospira bacterium HGW-Nitrospira-1]